MAEDSEKERRAEKQRELRQSQRPCGNCKGKPTNQRIWNNQSISICADCSSRLDDDATTDMTDRSCLLDEWHHLRWIRQIREGSQKQAERASQGWWERLWRFLMGE